ncbi:hypothetical protein FIBSPDRAFT_968695 [Athelia psychrophila]|uniref:WD40 repeat-like protein n=1 Tax=Athelia psychrophila TaxID=1759441 RepID=A0A167UBW1_9AGAM|nr:hypothetical protein FIBSPDRAFT_968695 [Fibularhizoctonia sp. CBS 109695]
MLGFNQQHDAQLDYCGKRLATCSSDCTVKVFDIVDGDTQRSAGHTLKGGRAHPKHGHILASSSYDGKVLIWKEQQGQRASANGWTKIKEHTLHSASGYDNLVKIWAFREDSQGWVEEEMQNGHTDWVGGVAWAPNIGLPRSYYISTASQMKDTVSSHWVKTVLDPSSVSTPPAAASSGKFPDVVWRVS